MATKTRAPRIAPLGAALIALMMLALLSGCEDNPVAEDLTCDHVDADGLRVEETGGTQLLQQWEGSNDGDIDLEPSEVKRISIIFLNPNQQDIVVGAECTQTLGWEIEDESIVQIAQVQGERWQVNLTAQAEGETTIRFTVVHAGHDDFKSQPIEVHVGDELDIDGLVLRSGGSIVASIDEGVVAGTIDVPLAGQSAVIDVFFTDHEGVEFQPEDEDFEFQWAVGDEGVATLQKTGDWSFQMTGVSSGSTTVEVKLWHIDHFEFESAPLPVSVSGAPPQPQALLLLDGEQWTATWYYDVTKPAQATGPLHVFEGSVRQGLAARFLDVDRDPISLPPGYSADWRVANTAIATIQPNAASSTSFDLTAQSQGSTSVIVDLKDDSGSTVWSSGSIPVLVLPSAGSDLTPTFQLRKNGRTDVGVIDGVAQANGQEVCTSPVWDAAFVAGVGEETTLYSVRYFDDLCNRIDLDSSHSLVFDFADRGLARVTNHPQHWGEIRVFHVNGLAAGSTTMRVIVLENLTDVVFISPPIPVVIGS